MACPTSGLGALPLPAAGHRGQWWLTGDGAVPGVAWLLGLEPRVAAGKRLPHGGKWLTRVYGKSYKPIVKASARDDPLYQGVQKEYVELIA